MKYNELTLKTKLYGSFGLIVLLSIIAVLTVNNKLSKTRNTVSIVNNAMLPEVKCCNKIQSHWLSSRYYFFLYLETDNGELLARGKSELDITKNILNRVKPIDARLNEELGNKTALNRLESLLDVYEKESIKVTEIVRNEGEVMNFSDDRITPLLEVSNRVNSLLVNLTDETFRSLEMESQKTEANLNTSIFLILFVAVIVLMVSAGLVWLVARQVSKKGNKSVSMGEYNLPGNFSYAFEPEYLAKKEDIGKIMSSLAYVSRKVQKMIDSQADVE
jgi:hypothetical protein